MKKVLVLGLLVMAVAAESSFAAPIVLRTGVDGANVPLGQGAIDPFWTISTDGGTTFDSAKVLFDDQICCLMNTAGGSASWISDPSIVDGSAATAWGIDRTVSVRRTFDASGLDLSTLALSGTWRLADWTMGIYLNGNLIPGTAIGNGGSDQSIGTWFSDHSLSVAAGSSFFASGLNTLEFRGQSINSGWDGVWFDGTVTGRELDTPVPEPTTLALLGAGLVAGARRLRQRRA